MSREPVRIGLVGYGRGGRFFHAPLIEQAPECVLAGVVTRSPQRRDELDKDHPGTRTRDLTGLADAGVDAVVITTPLDTHEPLVREAITLRLPVVSDKPFTPDAASARDLVAAAERAEVLLSVYQNRRWDADFLTVRKLVEAGELGEVVTFESRMEQYSPAGQFSLTGGGVLRDFGSHIVDQALRLFGPAASVYAQTHVVREQHNFDDRFFLSLRHHNGVISHLWGNWALQGPPPPSFELSVVPAPSKWNPMTARPSDSWARGAPPPRVRHSAPSPRPGGAGCIAARRPGAQFPPNAANGAPSTRCSRGRCAARTTHRSTRGTPSLPSPSSTLPAPAPK